jgi:hypothetical protein
MTNKPKNPIEIDTQPAYDPPQALRMGDIHAGTGGSPCEPTGSAAMVAGCQDGGEASGDCSTGGAADFCTSTGNSPLVGTDD